MRFLDRRNRRSPPASGHYYWKNGVSVVEIVAGFFAWGEAHKVYRRGWELRKAETKEWDLDHSSFLGLMATNLALYVEKGQISPERCGLLGRVHDWGEAVDYTPFDVAEIPRETRRRRRYLSNLPILDDQERLERRSLKDAEEERVMRQRLACLHPVLRDYHLKAWLEYRDQRSVEALFVHQIHALNDCVRCVLYKREKPMEDFHTFFDTAREVLVDEFLLLVLEEIDHRYGQVQAEDHSGSP